MSMTEVDEAVLAKLREREEQVGILCSLVDLIDQDNGEAIEPKPVVSLKTLFSDFVVRERSLFYADGRPLLLEALPDESTADAMTTTSTAVSQSGVETSPLKRERADDLDLEQILPDLEEKLKPLLPPGDVTKLLELVESGRQSVALAEGIEDKAARTQVHQIIRTVLKGAYVSTTEKGTIVVSKATGKEKREDNRRTRPLRSRPFLHFTLYKENLENNQALHILSKAIGVSVRQLQFCGSKDKRAVTLQRMCIQDLQPKRLSVVNSRKSGPNSSIKVCGFEFRDHGLSLGDSLGNHFRIVLRVSQGQVNEERYWEKVRRTIRQVGCINYFGPQRFGTTTILTSDIGLCLLRKQYKEALQLIFEAKSSFVPDLAQCVPLLKEEQYEKVLENTPHFCYDERSLIRHLVNQPGDYLGAFLALPRTLAMLYFHAVQSLVWNRIASQRIMQSRLVLPGDMVYESVYLTRTGKGGDSLNVELPTPPGSKRHKENKQLEPVRILTEEDAPRFLLKDIILPVPGPDKELVFPEATSCSRAAYTAELEKLGIPFLIAGGPQDNGADNDDRSPVSTLVKHFHFHGGYRELMLAPEDFQLAVESFKGWRTPLTPTDLSAQVVEGETEKGTGSGDTVDQEKEYVALIAEFSLPPGSYATCVLREFSRSTSEKNHSS